MSHEPEQHDPRNDPRNDPRMEALLDEALSPQSLHGGVPVDLAARIFAATKDQLPAAQDQVPQIIARIGVGRFKLTAALVLLACEVAVVTMASSIAHEVRDTLVVKREFAQLASYQPPIDAIDVEIELIDRQLDAALAGRIWDGASTAYGNEWDDPGLQSIDVSSEVVF